MAEPSFDRKMLEVLICPKTQTTLAFDAATNELISYACAMAFPIRSGVPIMLEAEARHLTDDEIAHHKARKK